VQIENPTQLQTEVTKVQAIKYCLYARKSSEAEEKQALSVDSQVKEMLDLANKLDLDIEEIY
jgi:hypothetical protein